MLRLFALVALSFVIALAARGWASQTQPPAEINPPIDLNDPANIAEGRKFFQVTCSHYCHGKDGVGGGLRAPSLRNRGLDSIYIFNRISNGRPPMPAFKTIYTPEQIWKLVAYVESLKD